MVDLGEGAKGTTLGLDKPDGFAATVTGTDDARKLAALSSWPRMVQVVDGFDLVPVEWAWIVNRDPEAVVRLRLRDPARLFGAPMVAVFGALPLTRPSTLTLPDGTVLLVGEGVQAPRIATRQVLLLGGPHDGAVVDTACSEIETVGRWVGDGWRRAGPDDDAVGVYYRVRPAAEVADTYSGPHPLDDREWVATFEGPRDGWRSIGVTTEPGPAGFEREALIDRVEAAMAADIGPGIVQNLRRLAVAAVDAMLADPVAGHVQCGGEADPDDVLVAIAEGVDRSYVGGADAVGVIQTALSVLRTLEASYTLHPRGEADDDVPGGHPDWHLNTTTLYDKDDDDE